MSTPLDKKLADMAREAARNLKPKVALSASMGGAAAHASRMQLDADAQKLLAFARSAIREAIVESGAAGVVERAITDAEAMMKIAEMFDDYESRADHETRRNTAATALAKLRALTQP